MKQPIFTFAFLAIISTCLASLRMDTCHNQHYDFTRLIKSDDDYLTSWFTYWGEDYKIRYNFCDKNLWTCSNQLRPAYMTNLKGGCRELHVGLWQDADWELTQYGGKFFFIYFK